MFLLLRDRYSFVINLITLLYNGTHNMMIQNNTAQQMIDQQSGALEHIFSYMVSTVSSCNISWYVRHSYCGFVLFSADVSVAHETSVFCLLRKTRQPDYCGLCFFAAKHQVCATHWLQSSSVLCKTARVCYSLAAHSFHCLLQDSKCVPPTGCSLH